MWGLLRRTGLSRSSQGVTRARASCSSSSSSASSSSMAALPFSRRGCSAAAPCASAVRSFGSASPFFHAARARDGLATTRLGFRLFSSGGQVASFPPQRAGFAALGSARLAKCFGSRWHLARRRFTAPTAPESASPNAAAKPKPPPPSAALSTTRVVVQKVQTVSSYVVIGLAGGFLLLVAKGVYSAMFEQTPVEEAYSRSFQLVEGSQQVEEYLGTGLRGFNDRMSTEEYMEKNGVEHVHVRYNVAGSRSHGVVNAEMKKVDREWTFDYVVVEPFGRSDVQYLYVLENRTHQLTGGLTSQ